MNNTAIKKRSIMLFIYIFASALLVELDQITKALAFEKLCNKKPFVIINDVFEFTYLENTGAAWGIMSGKINLFLILTVIIVFVITYIIIRMPLEKKYNYMRAVLIFLVSGAIGNFIDRVRFGYVRDFIYFKLINFPVFNVADCYITISVAAFALLFLFYYKDGDFEFLDFRKREE